jgi:hypothetical protein
MPVRPRSTLRATIVQLASDFAEGVLEAVRNVSLEDLLAEAVAPSRSAAAGHARAVEPEPRPTRKRGRRLARRSPADLSRVVERIVALLAQHPKGLRSEEIQAKLGLARRELPRPLADALAAHRIVRRGEKRATTYFAKTAAPAAKPRPAAKAKAKAKKAASARKRPFKAAGKAARKPAGAPAKPAPNAAPVTPAARAGAPS